MIICCSVIGIVACHDDLRPDIAPGSGECIINVGVDYRPMFSVLDGSATKAVGNAVSDIESICILLYDENGDFAAKYPVEKFSLKDETRPGSETEKTTKRATFEMTVPYGRYFIYAVVNMGNLDSYQESLKTVQDLENIRLNWIGNNISQNNQMFGHFNYSGKSGNSAPLLTINKKNMSLNASVRRCVSKVTVAYDGSQLEEGVFIYLKSVTIKDIPSSCLLGKDSKVTEESVADGSNTMNAGESIIYGSSKASIYNEYWKAQVSKGQPYYPYYGDSFPFDDYEKNPEKLRDSAHSEMAQALFFFENMQGKGEDKRQKDEDGDKLPDNADRVKDAKPYGTYIEVEGYYQSINPERLGSGPITYRFMLGKNVIDDYDAQRNGHYKLTLKFNRFANDADWHIDYEEDNPEIILPDTYFISYLYNHSMNLPLKINAKGHELISLKAKIDTNSWAPYQADDMEYFDYIKLADPNSTPGAPNEPWNGFLSLRKTKDTKISGNKTYYETERRGVRTYYENNSLPENDAANGVYSCSFDTNKEVYNFSIPMWTRAKTMDFDYTGNNPYVAYRRKAVVSFVAELRNKSTGQIFTSKQSVNILQVRRVVNPKGIWRKHNSTKPFHVVLKHLPGESASTFQTFMSQGRWKAYVVRGDRSLVNFDSGADTVRGSTGTPIDFIVNFRGTCGENESRFAIIRVEYHDYSCQHLIFVRQGDSPVQLLEGECKWHARNLFTGNTETNCPVEEGSMFKHGRLDYPIDATNTEPGYVYAPGPVSDRPFKIAGTETSVLWTNIPFASAFPSQLSVNGKEVRIPTEKDVEALLKSQIIEYGFGVMYGDDAETTLDDVSKVYGHRYDQNELGYGMRGVFIYNASGDTPAEESIYSGRNLFFPLGTAGYGRRLNHNRGVNVTNTQTGVLRYANRDRQAFFNPQRPMLDNLFTSKGAIYWTMEKGLDLNYFGFNVNHIDAANIKSNDGSSSDACFIRCVED